MKKRILIIGISIFLLIGIYFFLREFQIDLYKKDKQETKKIKKEIITKEKVEEEKEKGVFKNYYQASKKIVNEMTMEEKIGQLFLVRYNKSDIENLSKFYPGGYILFAKDFQNHNKETIKEEIKNAQNINKYPLIIGVDEEGGTVTRVSRYKNFRYERFKAPKDYYEEGGIELLEQTETEKATLLKELGINLNLAPVADVSTNPNDFIYLRTFGYDAKKTSELIKKMVELANNNKINSCLKHFPGYGNNIDTHTGIAIDNRSYEEFLNNDFLPFKAGIEANVPSILISHNIISSLDSIHPASLSSNVIKELRETLKFTGIIMTDDLAMDAVKSYVENGKAATLAINAGNDMIITSDFLTMYEEILKSFENKEIKEETINKAVLRIISWKKYSGLL